MPLLGKGVLAIWNGIASAAEEEFVAWHVREHIPERVALAGFLRGRRYASNDAHPKYFNFYETSDTRVLVSPAYKDRLNNPTDWTRLVVRHFTDTSRTICCVAESRGAGEGGWIATYRIFDPVDLARFSAACPTLLGQVLESPGIVAVHLLKGDEPASASPSSEKAMRATPDEVVSWILLIEAVDVAALERLAPSIDVLTRLRDIGAKGEIVYGHYQFQFGLVSS